VPSGISGFSGLSGFLHPIHPTKSNASELAAPLFPVKVFMMDSEVDFKRLFGVVFWC
jgi:hypothetical protein